MVDNVYVVYAPVKNNSVTSDKTKEIVDHVDNTYTQKLRDQGVKAVTLPSRMAGVTEQMFTSSNPEGHPDKTNQGKQLLEEDNPNKLDDNNKDPE